MDVRRVGRRRVKTDAVPGSDPAPQASAREAAVRAAEDTDQGWGQRGDGAPAAGAPGPNDERLKQDVPPHW